LLFKANRYFTGQFCEKVVKKLSNSYLEYKALQGVVDVNFMDVKKSFGQNNLFKCIKLEKVL